MRVTFFHATLFVNVFYSFKAIIFFKRMLIFLIADLFRNSQVDRVFTFHPIVGGHTAQHGQLAACNLFRTE